MSCIVLDIELGDVNVFMDLRVFVHGNVQGYSFRPPRRYKPSKQAVCCTKILHGIVWNSGRLNYSEVPNTLPSDVKGEYFGKGSKNCRILGSLMGKEVENLGNNSCPKVQDLVDEEVWICSSYRFRLQTILHCAERKAKLFCFWIMQRLKL